MDTMDWERLLQALMNLGLIVETVDQKEERITVRVPRLGEKPTWHL